MTDITAIEVRSNRDEYLAANPAMRKVQTAWIKRINRAGDELQATLDAVAKGNVKAVNLARKTGLALAGFAADADIPGKAITLDFWRQISGQRDDQLHLPFEFVKRCQLIARTLKEEVKTPDEARAYVRVFNFYWEIECRHDGQKRIVPPDEWELVSEFLDKMGDQIEFLKKLASNENYCPGGHLRDDLLAMNGQEWRRTVNALDEWLKGMGV